MWDYRSGAIPTNRRSRHVARWRNQARVDVVVDSSHSPSHPGPAGVVIAVAERTYRSRRAIIPNSHLSEFGKEEFRADPCKLILRVGYFLPRG